MHFPSTSGLHCSVLYVLQVCVFSTSRSTFFFFFLKTCLLQFMLILVFKDALESLKLERKPPFPEHPVGRQPACLWDGRAIQASHSLDQFSQDQKANQLLEILCLTGKWSWRQPLRTGAPLLQRQGPGAPWLPCDATGGPWAPRRRVHPPPQPPERCTQTPLTSSPRPGPPPTV